MRTLNILLGLAFAMAAWATGIGATILIKFYGTGQQIGFWKFGQYSLFMGLIFLTLLISLWAAIRALTKKK